MTGNPFSSDPEGERPGQTGALPRTGATHANARPMAEQDRPIWELDLSLQDLNVSALGHKRTSASGSPMSALPPIVLQNAIDGGREA
jgi:hypothetical protein